MRTKIIFSLLLLFVLFLTGSALTMISLYRTTSNLESVINLHRVEIIRQDLVISAQTVQNHLYSFGTAFGPELDMIVDNVITLDASARNCLSCHHNEDITGRLEEVISVVDQYQDALSYLITTSANEERVERLRMVAIGIGSTLLEKVQDMALIAGQKLNEKSFRSLQEINNSRVILIVTLILTFFIAIAIAVAMTRQVTEPIYELVDATRRIKAGEVGYTTPYKGKSEFRELIHSFNEMSATLEEGHRKAQRHVNNLSNLYSVTLTFHSITSQMDIYRELATGVAELVGADQAGLMLLEEGNFVHKSPSVGLDREATKLLTVTKGELLALYSPATRRAAIFNEGSDGLGSEADRKLNVTNLMYVWIKQKGEVVGAIRVANKRTGPFSAEDVHPLAILANNVSVALDNARLYEDLRQQMRQLQDAQEQLVQAAKLVAIGELASNVAHELNNPLTTVLGYAELIKEGGDPEQITADMEVIERECLRAKEIIRQLLEFARKRPLAMAEFDLSHSMEEVLDLVRIQVKKNNIAIKKDLTPGLKARGDENQLRQVFVNIINNACHAMEDKGTLTVRTYAEEGYTRVAISDTGPGIPVEIQSRIFEPFFSTKKEKGTGIGLSVSYQIIKSHEGRIDLQSSPEGTTFFVNLPA